jgi:hypothetical protein
MSIISIITDGDCHGDEKSAPPGLVRAAGLSGAAGFDGHRGRQGTGRHATDANNLVNGKAGVSPEMAVRLAKAFGSRAEVWLSMQMAYDLAQVRRHERQIKVRRVERLPEHAG